MINRPSLRECCPGEPAEALALALSLGGPGRPDPALGDRTGSVRLEISGNDLITAGVAEGPAIGRALDETLRRKLDGLVSGREQELATALGVARG